MITYLKGDATKPKGIGNKIITHVCNDIGGWGAGFVLALSKKWITPEKMYRSIAIESLKLGMVQYVSVENNIIVANIIGQHGIYYDNDGNPPVRYEAIKTALKDVNKVALKTNSTIHAPRFGSGLSGGEWNKIEDIINETLTVDVFIYDLP